uniref:Ig-like domain-containing protein n=1 Tax=Poecilia reticulata TaxID=8081 RepID=A0A3P9Q0F0_POERE
MVGFLRVLRFPPTVQKHDSQSGDLFMPLAVRAGDDVTLSCENVADGHRNCNTTNWTYSHSRQSAAVTLVEHGKIKDGRSDRLSVSANCSLVLKKVTSEDVGKYTCKQLRSGRHSGPDHSGSINIMAPKPEAAKLTPSFSCYPSSVTEHEEQHRRTLRCSVSTYERCKHRVKWLHMGISLDKENRDIKESSTSCSAAVTFKSSLYVNQSSLNSFKCEVKSEDEGEELKLFTFSSHSSGEKLSNLSSC